MGKNVLAAKVAVMSVSGSVAGAAGALYASYVSFVDPSSFTVMESVGILAMVIVGGAGGLWGPIVGAVLLVTLPEVLRFVGLPGAAAGSVRQILYGTALVGFMLWRPQGILGQYRFERGGLRA